MGLFGGKNKNKNKQHETDQVERRTTRRALVPGAKPAGKPDSQGKVAVRTGATRKPSEGKIPNADSDLFPSPNSLPNVNDGMIGSAAPPISSPALSNPGDRPTRGPIQAGQSRPPDFTGSLTSAKAGGICRTGDAALSEFLINKAKLLTIEQAAQVKEKARESDLPLDAAAVQLGLISEEQMVNALTQECWVPHLKVDKYEIRSKALNTISQEDALHYGVFPVDKLGSLLTLAMINPLDTETIRALEAKTGLDIKKVVATRSEITLGIDKYYSGKVQAKEGSISFTQDIEPKSVTAMLAKVNTTTAPLPAPRPVAPTSALTASDSIIPEIQDIDDLLAGDEAIAPAIIEPLSLNADLDPQIIASPAPLVMEGVEPLITQRPTSTPLPRSEVVAPEFQLGELPAVTTDTHLAPKPVAKPVPVSDLAIDLTPPLGARVRPASPISAVPRSPSLHTPHSANPVISSRPATPPKSATARFTAPAKSVDNTTGIINLIPVLEDEFQHAITHGKARTFEKWVGLQTRNRIINATPIDSELDSLLAGLYATKSI